MLRCSQIRSDLVWESDLRRGHRMELSKREIATLIAALYLWKEELYEGEERVRGMDCFQTERPLDSKSVDNLMNRFLAQLGLSRSNRDSGHVRHKLEFSVPTFYGSAGIANSESEEFREPFVPVLVTRCGGVRLVLGTFDYDDASKPDVHIERRPNGWAVFVHPDGGDPAAFIYILDDGRTFILPEMNTSMPVAIVYEIPPELDTT